MLVEQTVLCLLERMGRGRERCIVFARDEKHRLSLFVNYMCFYHYFLPFDP